MSERHFFIAICIKLGIDYSEIKEIAEAVALDEYMTGYRSEL